MRKPSLQVIFGLGALCVCVYLYLVNPSESRILPPCLFFWATGFYCSGCGSLRATHSILHGRIGTAIGYNAFFVFSIPLLVALVVFDYLQRPFRIDKRVIIVYLAIGVAFWILRNLPVAPFDALAP